MRRRTNKQAWDTNTGWPIILSPLGLFIDFYYATGSFVQACDCSGSISGMGWPTLINKLSSQASLSQDLLRKAHVRNWSQWILTLLSPELVRLLHSCPLARTVQGDRVPPKTSGFVNASKCKKGLDFRFCAVSYLASSRKHLVMHLIWNVFPKDQNHKKWFIKKKVLAKTQLELNANR